MTITFLNYSFLGIKRYDSEINVFTFANEKVYQEFRRRWANNFKKPICVRVKSRILEKEGQESK